MTKPKAGLMPVIVASQMPACLVALFTGGLLAGALALLISVACDVAIASFYRPAAVTAPVAAEAPSLVTTLPEPATAVEDGASLYLRRLRHDLRGALSPAMLTADRLLAHPDPTARRYGEVISQSVERAAQLLETPVPLP